MSRLINRLGLSATSGARRSKTGLFVGMVLASLCAMTASAQHTVNGVPGTATRRAIVNFKSMATLQAQGALTNLTGQDFSAPRPMPGGAITNGSGETGGFGPAGEPLFAPASSGSVTSPAPSISFQGLPDDNTVIPPDTHGAVGPAHIMTVLNSQVRIQDRQGGVLSTVSLDVFWLPTGTLNAFDPKALYDPYENRWMFTAMGDARSSESSVLIGVSQTSDPTGNWFLYRVDADASNLLWADYPSMGFTKDWIVVNANMFGITTPTNAWTSVYAFNKTNLYDGGLGLFTLFQEATGFTMVPAMTYDNSLPTAYLVEVDRLIPNYLGISSRLRLSTITGNVGSEVLTVGTAFVTPGTSWRSADISSPGFLPQLGSPFGIDGGDSRIQNVVYRNGSLWGTHTILLPAFFPTHTAAQWWQILPDGGIQQAGRIEDPSGVISYAYPSIAVNSANDVLIGFSRFSTNQYASGNYAFRSGGDPTNTMRLDYVLKAGEAPYNKISAAFVNRWGDYSSTVVDPLNDTDMWTVQEYAASPLAGTSRWGTWWGMVCGGSGARFEFSDYTVSEAPPPGIATITILNAGGLAGTVDFATSDGTAVAGTHYVQATGTLTFDPGQMSATFTVEIIDNPDFNTNRTINLVLSNPQGSLSLGCLTNAVLTIMDDETQNFVSTAGEFNFSSWVDGTGAYTVTMNESDFNQYCYPGYFIDRGRSALGVLVTVVRTNGSTGRVMVDYRTVDGASSAIPNVDYFPVSGTLVFDDYQMSTNFVVPLRNFTNGFFLLDSNFFKFISLELSNPRPAPEEETQRPGVIRPTLGTGSFSTILAYDVGLGYPSSIVGTNLAFTDAFAFERLHYRFDEHRGRDPRVIGGRTTNEISVVKRVTNGRVIVRLYNHVRGIGFGGLNNYPFGDLVGSTLTLGGRIVNAGSDYAIAPVGGSEVLANPIYTDPTLITITNLGDYVVRDVELDFANTCRREVEIIIENDPAVEFNEDIFVRLIPLGGNPPVNPYASICNVTVLYKDQPAGAVDREWNPDNVESTPDQSYNLAPGANSIVNSVVVQPDNKTLLGGDFTAVNSKPRNRIARMNADGSLDTSFNPGTGADSSIASVLLYPAGSLLQGRIVVAGGFSSYNGSQRNGIARLLADGSLDTSFAPGNGANGIIRTMAMQTDGKILIGGDFTEYNDFARNGLARIHLDGSLDFTFDPGFGADNLIWAIGATPDGLAGDKILIAGDFLSYNGTFRFGIAQLNADGTLDQNFDPGLGFNNSVYALAVQANGSILVGGAFTEFDARRRVGIARLNTDGSLDSSFDPGSGPNNPIFAVTIQPDQKAIIGGSFTAYNGTRRLGFARLRHDGALDTSFLDTGYNQFAGLINPYSFDSPNFVNSIAVQPDGNVMIGGSFRRIGGNPSYLADVPNHYTQFTRADQRSRHNIARVLGGATPGPGNTEFEVENYFVDENGGVASLKLLRTDGRLGTVVAIAGTADRTATVNSDFVDTNLFSAWPEAFYQTNVNLTFPVLFPTNFAPLSVGKIDPVFLRVPILDDLLQEGDELVDLSFIRPVGSITLGGEYIPLGAALGRSTARLAIVEDDFPAGTLVFSSPVFSVNENGGRATITVVRTNGSSGVVTVDYFTTTNVSGIPARAGITQGSDYTATSGQLKFESGELFRTFTVSVVNDTAVEFDESIGLVLTNAGGGAKLPGGTPVSIATATLVIVDNDFTPGRVNFAASSFTNSETEGFATVTVTRTGGNSDSIAVDFLTLPGSATTPSDYTSTNGTLNWNPGDSSPRTFTIPLRLDGLPEGPEELTVRLQNGRVNGAAHTNLLGLFTNSTVVIADSDAYGSVAFSQPFYQADENGGTAIITVVRNGGVAGTGTVEYATSPGSAVPGTDYLDTSGVFEFLPGEISKTFTVSLVNDNDNDGNKIVLLSLSNPSNLTLGVPSQVQLTLIDNQSFNEPAGTLDTLFSSQAQANGPVYALALQITNGLFDGRIVVAGDFTDFNEVSRARLARLMTNGTLDVSFDPGIGANDSIRTLAVDRDGKVLIGGFFTQVLGTNRNHIARLNPDGSLDASFNPGAGADNPVFAINLQPDGRILVGGAFSAFNSISRPGIVRLNTNGTVDASFNVGAGANGPVYAIALQADGSVLIGGDFTAVNGVTRNRIARLNANGSLDLTFDPGDGMSAAVRALLYQADGRVVAGGSFTFAGGDARNYLARLNSDGSLDTSFLAAPLIGADNSVFTLALQGDGKIVVGGDFTQFNGVSRNRITRLNVDGTSDPTINFGAGTDGFISTLLIQPDRKIILGGGFTTYDGVRRPRIARIHGGGTAGPGTLEFSRPEFLAGENSTNAVINVRRRGGTTGVVGVDFRTVDGTALAGVDYQSVSGTLGFAEAETFQTFSVPIINNFVATGDRSLTLELIQGTFTGGAVAGAQPASTLRILDDEGIVSFSSGNFSVNENVANLFATIVVQRTGATNGPVSVSFATVAGGTSTAGTDYVATNGTLSFLPGEITKSFHVRILDDALNEGSETVLLSLTNASNSNALGVASATLNIVDNEFSQGQFVFSAITYSVQEDGTNALLTVLRTNGSSGFATVTYRTFDSTADGGIDFVATNQVLAFADGEKAKTIAIPILDDLLVETPETFNVVLMNPTGGATLGGANNVVVTILNNDTNQVVPAGATLLAENLVTNNIIDPGEQVTFELRLRNVGNGDTTPLTGTLLAQSRVTLPSAPQFYGVLQANGAAVGQVFSFTAVGAVGDSVVATLLLTDGITTNGFATFRFTIGGQASRSFTNSSPIIIGDGMASPYPAGINVTDLGGTVTKVTVGITNFNHEFPDDVDMLLIGPSGERVMLMSDAGSTAAQPNPVLNLNLTFDAAAASAIPDTNRIFSGTYRPANYAGPNQNTADTFPAPAPQPVAVIDPFPYTNTALAVFNGSNPNGTWLLFVYDDTTGLTGRIGGWSLTIQTSDPVSPAAGVSLADLAISGLGPVGTVPIGANVSTSFVLTNRGPATAENTAVIETLPAGMTLVSASANIGSWTKVQNTLTWTLGSIPSGGSATMTLITKPTVVGTHGISALASANQIDLNTANNSSTMFMTVGGPPSLTVNRQNNSVFISWSASSGYKLQASDSLQPGNWQDVTAAPQVVNGQNVVTLGVSAGGTLYFRLRSP